MIREMVEEDDVNLLKNYPRCQSSKGTTICGEGYSTVSLYPQAFRNVWWALFQKEECEKAWKDKYENLILNLNIISKVKANSSTTTTENPKATTVAIVGQEKKGLYGHLPQTRGWELSIKGCRTQEKGKQIEAPIITSYNSVTIWLIVTWLKILGRGYQNPGC